MSPAAADNPPSNNPRQNTPRGFSFRALLGGGLMGLANLVPGISGGTMLLATGVYTDFIQAVADVTTFKFRLRTIIFLACIVGAAVVAIVSLAGPVSTAVIHHTWAMYSLFIGLTLGGAPILWKMIKPATPGVIGAILAGVGIMAIMAFIGPAGSASATSDGHPYGMYLLAGIAGASAMVLPGISGGYLLLILGQYVTILTAVSMFKDALQARDLNAAMEPMHVIIPVGIGVLIGVVGISNLLRWLLARAERPTLGVLLGLLLGAVLGLWPFQHGVAPAEGTSFRGETILYIDGTPTGAITGRVIEAQDWPMELFTPSGGQIAGALALIVVGFLVSIAIARLGTPAVAVSERSDR